MQEQGYEKQYQSIMQNERGENDIFLLLFARHSINHLCYCHNINYIETQTLSKAALDIERGKKSLKTLSVRVLGSYHAHGKPA